jgi:hypothetical protein
MRIILTSPPAAALPRRSVTESSVTLPSRMPIRFHLNGQRFDPETIRVMALAYELALISLRLFDRGDIANDVVASKIIEHAKAGERDPERLCEAVLQQWRGATLPPPIAPSDQI